MNTYMLTIPEDVPSSFDPTQLAIAVASWWPQHDMRLKHLLEDDFFILEWYTRFPEDDVGPASTLGFTGGLLHDRRTVAVRGSLVRCLECALHVRALLPFGSPLRVSKHGTDDTMILGPGITRAQLLAHFVPALSPLAWQILQTMADHPAPIPYAQIVQHVHVETYGRDQINTELYALWRNNCISSPGVRWLPERPTTIDGLFDDRAWHTSLLSLMPDGRDVLTVKESVNLPT